MSIKDIKKDEVRGFKISGDALSELLWELLNKSGDMLLDLPDNSDTIFHMHWDREKDELTFYALEFRDPHPVDFKAIDRYIDENLGITTDSVFLPKGKPYKTLAPDASSGARVFCNCNYSTRPSRTLRS